ncbi:8-oxoguanine glycosylase ogg1 [Lecanicillium sp. MT-2017a]|nr:8-oxoguanine glycosylase ogg1 [Lecanicillium sp. MT-2017a]
MAVKRVANWQKLPVTLSELCIDTTLRCGQSFRWRKINEEWTCALHGRILSLKQDPKFVHYKVTWPEVQSDLPTPPSSVASSAIQDDTEELLRHYFSLYLDLGSLYKQWSDADPNFRKKAPQFTGVRILSQDAWEALVCFICSSNNNIARISQMVHKLCANYGPLIGHVGNEPIHDFPTPDALAGKGVESRLRELGFGYRAKYIAETARVIAEEKPSGWLQVLQNPEQHSLLPQREEKSQNMTYREAHDELLKLTGVGPKVADCVCLMGLGWGESVPVDTHVWQIAQRDYKMGKSKTKTFNKVMYDAVGDHFRGIWGKYAGWAHSVLFTADLRSFSDRSIKREQIATDESNIPEEISPKKRSIKAEPDDGEGIKVEDREGAPSTKRRRTRRQL